MRLKSQAELEKISKLWALDWELEKADTKYHTHGYHTYSGKYIPQIPRSRSTRVGVICGQPSFIRVATKAKFFSLKSFAIGSVIWFVSFPPSVYTQLL
jgi:hypothetical protein